METKQEHKNSSKNIVFRFPFSPSSFSYHHIFYFPIFCVGLLYSSPRLSPFSSSTYLHVTFSLSYFEFVEYFYLSLSLSIPLFFCLYLFLTTLFSYFLLYITSKLLRPEKDKIAIWRTWNSTIQQTESFSCPYFLVLCFPEKKLLSLFHCLYVHTNSLSLSVSLSVYR